MERVKTPIEKPIHRSKKTIFPVLLSAAALAVSAAALFASASEARYSDVTDAHWARGAIEAMSQKGIIAGYPDGSFKPGETVTYGEFIKMAVIAGTGRDVGVAGGDVGNPSWGKDAHWAESYHDAGVAAGYFHAHNIPKYQLPWEIPREDMALIAAAVIGDGEAVRDYDEVASNITDLARGTNHEYAIIAAYSSGVLTGYPDDTFRPKGTLTRAEAATVIDRLVKLTARGGEPTAGADEPEGPSAPLTTEERLAEYEYTLDDGTVMKWFDYVNWVATSASKRPISEVISNLKDFDDVNFYGPGNTFENLKYYEIVTDYPYEIIITDNLVGEKILKFEGPRLIASPYRIKDKKINLLQGADPYLQMKDAEENYLPPTDFDYLGFYLGGYSEELGRVCDTMMLLPNPFR